MTWNAEKTGRNAQIVRRYLAGVKIADLARDYGVSRTRIREVIDAAGVQRQRQEKLF